MAKSGQQTKTGKAFEYACANVLYHKYQSSTHVTLVESPQMTTARLAFASLTEQEQIKYLKGAEAAVRIVDRLEPNLSNERAALAISLQPDAAGIKGDVRDVLCLHGADWQIGFSCKHNHEAVKHSRLSDQIDFGKEWFNKPCSHEYFSAVKAVFAPLRKLRDESSRTAQWSAIEDKETQCYVPILNAFMAELQRLNAQYPGEIPKLLIKYLIGVNDFYKVIMNDARQYTTIEAININGSLNKKSNSKRALLDVPVMKLPSKFYEIGYKDGSKNTINVICDQGWNVSMRIHNASSKIEPSLKFDVQLLAMPSSIITQMEPWTELEFEY